MNCSILPYKGSTAARKFTLLGFALALVASLTGCAVGPKYHRPIVNVQPFHNAPAVEARKTTAQAPPLDRWWIGFQDPELTKIVERAVEENLDLAASLHRVEQARACLHSIQSGSE